MEMKTLLRKSVPHFVALFLFLLLDVIYFAPVVFDNKELPQGDVTSAKGWGQDLREYHEETGDYAFWSNRMFGGMPANYAFMPKMPNVFREIGHTLYLGMPRTHMNVVFLYLLCFYVFLLAIGCTSWLSFFGAIAFSFVSYNFIIIDAGHVAKGLVMATMAPIVGGVMLAYKRKYALGSLLVILGVGLNVYFSHQQISYYLLLMLLGMAIVYFIYALKSKTVTDFFKASGVLLIAALLGVAPSLGDLVSKADYTKDTMRGGTVLHHKDDTGKETSGLKIDYAYQWSYGIGETMSLLVPNIYGGSSNYDVGEKSAMYQTIRKKAGAPQAKQYSQHAPMYWGDQPFTSGPVYAGALICVLFLLGFFILKGPEKWWLLVAFIIGMVLSWGRNFPLINNFIFYHLPLYNKFRTPSMALVLTNLSMAIMAVLALKEIVQSKSKTELVKPLLQSTAVVGGVSLFIWLLGSSLFSFQAASDMNYPNWLQDALVSDRKMLLRSDALRSLIYILLGTGFIWMFLKGKFQKVLTGRNLVIALTLLTLVDLWSVDKRFLNDAHFVSKKQAKSIVASPAIKQILQDKDPNFRVFNLSTNTFNESRTSYYINTIGGYSPAKLRRTQDIIDYYLSSNMDQDVINMMNTKYFIVRTKQGEQVQQNPYALGHAWFVDQVSLVDSPDAEIEALGKINPANQVVIEDIWNSKIENLEALQGRDSTAQIILTDYVNPGHLKYQSSSSKVQMAVFPEVYYKTWYAYVDGQEVPLLRVNYNFRGIVVPQGNHTIEMKCIDHNFASFSVVSLIASIIVALVLAFLLFVIVRPYFKKNRV